MRSGRAGADGRHPEHWSVELIRYQLGDVASAGGLSPVTALEHCHELMLLPCMRDEAARLELAALDDGPALVNVITATIDRRVRRVEYRVFLRHLLDVKGQGVRKQRTLTQRRQDACQELAWVEPSRSKVKKLEEEAYEELACALITQEESPLRQAAVTSPERDALILQANRRTEDLLRTLRELRDLADLGVTPQPNLWAMVAKEMTEAAPILDASPSP